MKTCPRCGQSTDIPFHTCVVQQNAQLVIDNIAELSDQDARRVMHTALRNLMGRADSGMPVTSDDIGTFLNIAADGRLLAKLKAVREHGKHE